MRSSCRGLVVNVRVNVRDEVSVFIDTGGSQVALDTDFARELLGSRGSRPYRR